MNEIEQLREIHPLFKIYYLKMPKKIIFGLNSLERITEEAKNIGGKKALLITDKSLEKTNLVKNVIQYLEKAGYSIEVFNEVEPEPKLSTSEGIKNIVEGKNFDLIVGFGGGSVLDTAKIASILATNPGKIEDYLGFDLVKKPGLPKILIPTTAGTGSEITRVSVFTKGNTKVSVYSDYLFADVAIVDPLVTISLPPHLTASTGFDALSHAIEAYMSLGGNILTDTISLKVIEIISKYLRRAYFNGNDIEARYYMSIAATMAGICIANAMVCLGHAIGLVLGVKYHLSHGVSCALALPYTIEYNSMVLEEKIFNIAKALGERIDSSLEENSIKVVNSIKKLMKDVGLPISLKEIKGASMEDIPELAQETIKIKRLLIHNPRKVSYEDAIGIFNKMFEMH
ncbi:MAG: iron-containing alcohol dehydrogenase [Candidatus Aenigmatarchaeota archaeon]